MPVLTKDQILKADDRSTTTIKVKEWGGDVRLRSMSVGDLLVLQGAADAKDPTKAGDFMLQAIALCVVDDKGAPIFSEEDIAALREKGPKAITHVWNEVAKLNGLGGDAEKN